MLNLPTYECLWAMCKEVPSGLHEGQTIYDDVVQFTENVITRCNSRLVDRNGVVRDVASMGFSNRDRMQLMAIITSSEEYIADTKISDWFSPEFFQTNFWFMWMTTFAFQPWHSAAEFRRYVFRFPHEYSRLESLAGIARTPMNQYDTVIKPISKFLVSKGVQFQFGCVVTDVETVKCGEKVCAEKIVFTQNGEQKYIQMHPDDLIFIQNGCMTDATSVGTHKTAAKLADSKDAISFNLWEKLAKNPGFGNPAPFYKDVTKCMWQSFSVTMRNPELFRMILNFQRNKPQTTALSTFIDSNWIMSYIVQNQPHFANQPSDVQVFWGYALLPYRVGNFINKPMLNCTGEEIFYEFC